MEKRDFYYCSISILTQSGHGSGPGLPDTVITVSSTVLMHEFDLIFYLSVTDHSCSPYRSIFYRNGQSNKKRLTTLQMNVFIYFY